jgi:predicted nuclease of predicted toxin-antitoxin system
MAERVRFYTDEHVARAVVEGLRRRGVDVLTVAEADMPGARDEEHLAFARREGRVLFTQDADFLRLHAHGVLHAGIVYAHQQGLSTGEIIHGLMLVYEVMEADEMVGHLEYL